MEHTRTDAILMEIIHERKTITGFLDAVFGFLRRNTDFYHIKKEPSEKIGFPRGVREQIVFGAMERYDLECVLPKAREDETGDVDAPPPALTEIEVETEVPTTTTAFAVEDERMDEQETQREQSTKEAEKACFTVADYKNGALHENYCWSQTLRDVELQVKLPPELQNARLLKIEIAADNIMVKSREQPDVVVISGQLSNKCKHNEVVWTVSEGKLLISFDKSKEIWWEKLFTTEDCIDIKRLDCERYIDELPEDTQAAIHKLRVQQMEQDHLESQQRITPYETETLSRLRKAWDAENSPFQGQPFDPSIVNFC